MKIKPKGRKIYRQKSKFERMQAFRTNTAAIFGTILTAGVLVFVGYSVGRPVIRFLQESRILTVPNEVEETIPPTQATAPPEEMTEPETAETAPVIPDVPQIRGCQLDVSALMTQTALDAAVAAMPEDITHVLVPLKTKGGKIYFATEQKDVARIGAVQATLPLTTICETITSAGFEPVAVINTLEDEIFPRAYMDAAFHYEGGEVWLTAPPEQDGAPRMSPFHDLTLDYLGKLAAEAEEAGFGSIVCEGLTFPDFSEEDLTRIETRAAQEGRYTALVKVIETMQEKAPHAAFYVLIDAYDLLMNRNDSLIAADSSDLTALILRLDSFTADKTDLLKGQIQRNACLYAWDGIPVPEGEGSYIYVNYAPVSPERGEDENQE